jgi:hypothetical protein
MFSCYWQQMKDADIKDPMSYLPGKHYMLTFKVENLRLWMSVNSLYQALFARLLVMKLLLTFKLGLC